MFLWTTVKQYIFVSDKLLGEATQETWRGPAYMRAWTADTGGLLLSRSIHMEINVTYCKCIRGKILYMSWNDSVWYGSSDTYQMASLESLKGLTHPSDQDPSWEESPHPKIETNKCVSKWPQGIIQCFKPMFFVLFFFLGAVHLWRQPLWGEGGSTKFWHLLTGGGGVCQNLTFCWRADGLWQGSIAA